MRWRAILVLALALGLGVVLSFARDSLSGGAASAALAPELASLSVSPAALSGSWQGALLLQNQSANSATVLVEYYKVADQSRAGTSTTSVAGYGTVSIPLSSTSLPSGSYSVVVSSDREVASVVQEDRGTTMRTAYAVADPATTIYMPRVLRGLSGWNSSLFIQSASTSPVSYTILFRRLSDGGLAGTLTGSIAGGASVEVTSDSFPVGDTQYAVEVVGSAPLSGVVRLVDEAGGRAATYRAVGTAGSRAYLPLLSGSWGSVLTVQNVDTAAANITVRFYRLDNGAETAVGPLHLAAGAALVLGTPNPSLSYAAVIAAARLDGMPGKVAAVADFWAAGAAQSYAADSRGGTTLHFPYVQPYSPDAPSFVVVQNTSPFPATGTASFYGSSNGALVAEEPINAAPGRAQVLSAPGGVGPYNAVVRADSGRSIYGIATAATSGGGQAASYEAVSVTFADVPVSGKEWMKPWIEAFYAAGITTGCAVNPPQYCPEREVTRAEIAVFLERAMHYPNLPYTPPSAGGTFADVPVPGKEWMEAWIEKFYADGISSGCGVAPLRYCPDRSVTRAEMAVLLLRAEHGPGYTPPASTGIFADVPVAGKEWMQPWIEQFYREGITTGCAADPLRYCPEREVTRAEMAVFILRAFGNIPGP